jgi:hypothetical protein
MAQTLKFGNGTWATKKDSILAYSDTNENYKPLPFNYTGAGKGTRVNKEGLIEVVENDRPRIDYTDSEDGVFLLEKADTNVIPYSKDFSQWISIDGVVRTDNFTNSPDGTQNASKLVFNGTPNSRVEVQVSLSGTNTQSVYLKTESGTQNVSIGAGSSDLTEFTITDQWVRYTHTGTGNYPRILCNDAATIYAWGCQYESGNVASSYIPTQGSAQTRVAETANGSGNSEVFNDSEGVLFANIAANADDLTQRALGLSDGTSSNRMSIVYNDGSSNALRMFVSNPSGTKSYITNSFNITQNNKISIKLNGTSLAFWVNGFEIHTDALNSAFVNGTLDTFDFAFFDNNTPFYGKTKEIGYYDEILTDLELETLTSYRTWESMVKELNLNVIYNG